MHGCPIVSIVVPTFNRVERLKRCIYQIRHNVACPHETIVVDGGSTDGTREWLVEQNNLRVILEPERERAAKAFNKGFRAARGYYVMWLNDDAYLDPRTTRTADGGVWLRGVEPAWVGRVIDPTSRTHVVDTRRRPQ